MRKLLVGAVLGLSMFSALAHAIPDWIIPSPITIAIQVGRWMMSQDKQEEVYYIRVQSKGATETEARNEAFRLSVDQAVGSLLVSETKIENGNLQSHETINYSSGYIHDFKYVNIHRGNEVVLQVDVWVKKSKIAERISLKNQAQGKLEGGRIAESFRSLAEQNLAGDKLLQSILSDFPERALNINITNIEYINEQRVPVLKVNFDVWWKPKYIQSLEEILENVGQKRRTSRDGNGPGVSVRGQFRCDGYFCDDRHYATDLAMQDLVWRELYGKKTQVLITILDTHNQPVYQTCAWWDNMQGNSYGRNQLYEYTTIYKEAYLQNHFKLDLSNQDISKMDRVDLQTVRVETCPHYNKRK